MDGEVLLLVHQRRVIIRSDDYADGNSGSDSIRAAHALDARDRLSLTVLSYFVAATAVVEGPVLTGSFKGKCSDIISSSNRVEVIVCVGSNDLSHGVWYLTFNKSFFHHVVVY